MSETLSRTVRRTMHFTGTVQGVGFRYTTHHVASGFEVTGHVRNLRDGRVKMVAEGAADEIDRFVRAVQDRMSGYISDTDVETAPATGEFTTFDIAF